MRETQWKKIVYVIFYCILIIFFLWKFGHPAVVKYISNEVFLKISTSPADRSRIEKISLPAITFCASEVSSVLSQVILQTITRHINILIMTITRPGVDQCQYELGRHDLHQV